MKLLDKTLHTSLSIKRPHGGFGVKTFSKWIRRNLPSTAFCDSIGNIHYDARTEDSHRSLFTAHLDTVHRQDGVNDYKVLDNKIFAAGGVPLGADNGSGCAILMHMIENKVPGYYIFTQGEEKGGIGSGYIAKYNQELLLEFDRAVAFDRKSTHSVITYQWGGRCCSEEFAEALSDVLNDHGMLYAPDDTGLYTDTAEFVEFIPECTNVSVGYYNEHSKDEYQDMDHLRALANAVININWDDLPVGERVEDEPEDPVGYYTGGSRSPSKGWGYTPNTSAYEGAYWEDDRDALLVDYYREVSYKTGGNQIEDLLVQAENGRPSGLISRVAEWAYPSDPDHAKKFLTTRKITPAKPPSLKSTFAV